MLRWSDVADQELYGLTVKMYREPYTCLESVTSIYHGLELDHYAYKHLGSELLAYKILDVNFERYMEERGDMNRIKGISIPVADSMSGTVL